MDAIVVRAFGGPDVLQLEQIEPPSVGPGQVLIEVAVSGVQFFETFIRRGDGHGVVTLPEPPYVPGTEVAGVVAAVGDGVDRSWVGQRVVAGMGGVTGGYARQAVVGADALFAVTAELSFEDAIAMLRTGRTVVQILDEAVLTPSDVVMVLSAAGGIGSLFVQEARHVGCTVVGVAHGQAKVEAVLRNGADIAVDDQDDGWPDAIREQLGGREPTIVFDGVGGAIGKQALLLLGTAGRFLMFGFASGTTTEITTADLRRRSLTATWQGAIRPVLHPGGVRGLSERALENAATGRWRLPIQRYPLAEAAEAHRAIEARTTVGKLVLI